MHIHPFLFQGPNMDFLGNIRLSKSRRDKDKWQAHVNIGDGWEHIITVDVNGSSTFYGIFAYWLWSHDVLADTEGPFNVENLAPYHGLTHQQLSEALLAHGGFKVRFQ